MSRSSYSHREMGTLGMRDFCQNLWAKVKEKEAETDPLKKTRSFLIACSLPQVVAIYAAVRSTLYSDAPIFMASLMPEGTQMPAGTSLLLWLTDNEWYRANSLADISNMQLGMVAAASWLAAIFCVLWRVREPLTITRRWIVLTMIGWILVVAWLGGVLIATWSPFARLGIEYRETPWWRDATSGHLVGLLWSVAVAVIVYRVWRRDSRSAE